jgi:hypothetical protein
MMLSNIAFCGMLSVWKAPEVKPSKAWKGPNGGIAPVPKDDCAGIMISAFQSHEFGFGMHICDEQLNEVNKYHEE